MCSAPRRWASRIVSDCLFHFLCWAVWLNTCRVFPGFALLPFFVDQLLFRPSQTTVRTVEQPMRHLQLCWCHGLLWELLLPARLTCSVVAARFPSHVSPCLSRAVPSFPSAWPSGTGGPAIAAPLGSGAADLNTTGLCPFASCHSLLCSSQHHCLLTQPRALVFQRGHGSKS
jgi:hypothetical protein